MWLRKEILVCRTSELNHAAWVVISVEKEAFHVPFLQLAAIQFLLGLLMATWLISTSDITWYRLSCNWGAIKRRFQWPESTSVLPSLTRRTRFLPSPIPVVIINIAVSISCRPKRSLDHRGNTLVPILRRSSSRHTSRIKQVTSSSNYAETG